MEKILALIALALLVGVPFWFATRKPKKKQDNWGTSDDLPAERSGAVQAGYDVLHPGSQ